MRCPSCGAHNVDAAAWCTQCFERFDVRGDPSQEPAPPQPAAPPLPPGPADPPVVADTPPPLPGPPPLPPEVAPTTQGRTAQRDIRVDGDRIEWRCASCEGWNPLERPDCGGCGSARVGFTPGTATPPAVATTGGAAPLLASALLPGLGHLLVGRPGSGIARLLLWLLWAGGAGAILVSAGLTGAALVLALAAIGLWILTLHDLLQLARGRPEVLTGRVLAWSVVVVTTLLVLLAVAGAGGSRT
ncbi:MAG: hypothetical protein EA387_10250 [Nitriliruptor sp.]|nr:MAG: hypothetical protein EA387_10250 [Nitriliruptor sp.]